MSSRSIGAPVGRARAVLAGLIAVAALAAPAAQSPLFTDAFPPEEFAARRARVLEAIGDGVAILQGAAEYPAYVRFRQNNQFFYLSGVEVPRAMLVLDGRAKAATLYLPPRDERLERSEGPVLVPGPEAAQLTGIPDVRPREAFAAALDAFAREGRTLYLPHRPEALGAATPAQVRRHAEASLADPWDGRPSRAQAFIDRVKARAPRCEIRDLDPILDRLRLIKSDREIALVRRATRIAGEAILEAMRAARPGLYEYELAAIGDYMFRRNNAQGIAYFALVAAGPNAFYPHYHAAQSRIAEGDLVLYDYAPDYKYYTSDVTRMFPASGRWRPDQRERYTLYLHLYQALLGSIRPHLTPRAIREEAVRRMEVILAARETPDERLREAARRFVDDFRRAERRDLGHFVGMEVHDVSAPYEVLQPGMIFTIEPALRIPEERVYLRLEDVLLVTEDGVENLSGFVPAEPDEIERVMAEESPFDLFDRRKPATASR
ncbi:MAG TPA: Xaa-Pro peptidase family protein [Vicinamibacterales bacterium]|nr:Xaa-Pro peptidase family protein [Vicinamibacterales bacterium]